MTKIIVLCVFIACAQTPHTQRKLGICEVIWIERSGVLKASTHLRRKLALAVFAVAAALLAMTAATFAWYIYNTSARTTQVKMVAGSSVTLQIANTPEGPYSSSAVMQSFTGLLTPVSTDRISGGFQKVRGYSTQSNRLVANLFLAGTEAVDYYKTSLYLKTNAQELGIYLANIGFEDTDSQNPTSTAMRLGIVANGQEFIFAVNTDPNPSAGDNAAKEPEGGYVLDSSKTDGSTLPFTPYTRDNFCVYNQVDGSVSLPDGALRLCTVSGDGQGGYGEAVKLDIYLWLEGCDEDCTQNLAGQTMKNLALSFAGSAGEGA